MNYFPFHIGDYASATRHLSWDEDMAYRRLLDWYYTDEKPLILDIGKICRKVIATTESQKQAVQSVLEEFFVQTDEGWRHLRADEELASMQEKQAANGEREEHEKTRMQKHRERRSAMFAQLAEVGVYPAWNAKTGEVERLISEHCGKPVTPPVTPVSEVVTAPVTAPVTPETQQASLLQRPATAIPTPTPTPIPKRSISSEPLPGSEPMTIFSVPLNDSTEYRVPAKDFAEWEKAFPAVDVSQELREIRVWCMANQTKRKTRRGVSAFIVKWLARAQDTPSHHRPSGRNSNPTTGDLIAGAL